MLYGVEGSRKFENCLGKQGFHRGRHVSCEVIAHYRHLRTGIPPQDKITGQMLDLIERHLLRIDPSERCSAEELQERLSQITDATSPAYMSSRTGNGHDLRLKSALSRGDNPAMRWKAEHIGCDSLHGRCWVAPDPTGHQDSTSSVGIWICAICHSNVWGRGAVISKGRRYDGRELNVVHRDSGLDLSLQGKSQKQRCLNSMRIAEPSATEQNTDPRHDR